MDEYKKYKGLSPAQAELNYLNKVKWLEMYGVDMHTVLVRIYNQLLLSIFLLKEKCGLGSLLVGIYVFDILAIKL